MIQPTSSYSGYNRAEALKGSGAKPAPDPKGSPAVDTDGDEKLSSANTEALRTALSNTPEVRPDVVERGKKLASDTNYPPREIIEKLAELMTRARETASE